MLLRNASGSRVLESDPQKRYTVSFSEVDAASVEFCQCADALVLWFWKRVTAVNDVVEWDSAERSRQESLHCVRSYGVRSPQASSFQMLLVRDGGSRRLLWVVSMSGAGERSKHVASTYLVPEADAAVLASGGSFNISRVGSGGECLTLFFIAGNGYSTSLEFEKSWKGGHPNIFL